MISTNRLRALRCTRPAAEMQSARPKCRAARAYKRFGLESDWVLCVLPACLPFVLVSFWTGSYKLVLVPRHHLSKRRRHRFRGVRVGAPHSGCAATQNRMALVATAACEFIVEPPTAEISTGWQGTASASVAPSASAGGVWEGHGRRGGHQVCWRVSGAELEVSETCLLPGASLIGGDLRLRFATSLLPPVGLSQLTDDSLLLSVAMHAPSGGVFVYQLRFQLRPDADLLDGAVVRRASWFAAAAAGEMDSISTPEPVGASLGVVHTAAFDAKAEAAGGREWRTSLLLGGDATHALHVTLVSEPDHPIKALQSDLRSDRSTLTGYLGSIRNVAGKVAGEMGLAAGGNVNPHELVCALAHIRLPTALCALVLARNGRMQLWQLNAPAAAGGGGAGAGGGAGNAAALLTTVDLGRAGGGGVELLGGGMLSVWQRSATLGVAVSLGGAVHATSCTAGGANEVAAHLSDVGRHWKALGAPGAAAAPAGHVLKLAIAPTTTDAYGTNLCVYALVSSGLPALWTCALGAPTPAWSQVHIDADAEQALALDDTTTATQPADDPLMTVTDFFVARLLRPSRFAPRHIAGAMRALLPTSPSPFANAGPAPPLAVAAAIRAGLEARLSELDPSQESDLGQSVRLTPF